VKTLIQGVPGEGLDLHVRIVDNVVDVVEVPFALEAVAVNDQEGDGKGKKGKGVFPGIGETPLQMEVEIIVLGYPVHDVFVSVLIDLRVYFPEYIFLSLLVIDRRVKH
jgi:hypothetical protein